MYYIGIDGGAYYSKLISVDGEMRILGRHMGNAVNLSKLPLNAALDNLTRLLAEFSKLTHCAAKDCAGICIGLLGSEEAPLSNFSEALQKIGFSCPVNIVSCAEITLAAHTKAGPGILVYAGTDSYGFAADDKGHIFRCGGLGCQVDGGGGGYVIGMQAVKYAFMSFDGRIPCSLLEERVCQHLGVKTINEALPNLRSGAVSKTKISELALVVKYAAENGDECAKAIQEEAAKELFLLARAPAVNCVLAEPVVVLGGPVLLLNDLIRREFTALLKNELPNIAVETLNEKPEIGAVHLIMKNAAG